MRVDRDDYDDGIARPAASHGAMVLAMTGHD